MQNQLKIVQHIPLPLHFAAVLGDGFVVTWDSARDGGDNCTVQDQLKTMQQTNTRL